tara:strand:- start:42 stop:206 length:165 start_codon:yes stop_codon:yes gene_type:complete
MSPHAMILKWVLPKVLDHIMKVFKLDQVLRYVEEDNELDVKVKELEKRLEKLES